LFLFTSVIILSNLFFLFNFHSRKTQHLEDGLYPDLVPAMPVETVNFIENKIYSSPPSAESDQAWDRILPPGRGYVFSPNAHSDFGLPQGEVTKYGEIYSVTVFHQLHCLGMLRTNYWSLINKMSQEDPEDAKKLAEKHRHNHHANHCFDYLRQSLQCGADMTLEWPVEDPRTGKRNSVDGWNTAHMCKSWV
jgi:hypothetical protein